MNVTFNYVAYDFAIGIVSILKYKFSSQWIKSLGIVFTATKFFNWWKNYGYFIAIE